MPKWVGNNSERRWNNAAGIVEGGGAGWRKVPGIYREPRGAVGGSAGDTALSITCYATADFDNSDATIPIHVLKVRNGTGVSVDDTFTIPNKLWKHGTAGEYAYGGLTGTIIEAQRDDDEVWTILEMTCTIPCCPEAPAEGDVAGDLLLEGLFEGESPI